MSRKIRAKFYCNSVENETGTSEMAKLSAVYGSTEADNEENNQFSEATPYGKMEMQIDNPDAMGFFEEGKEYYLDFQEATES